MMEQVGTALAGTSRAQLVKRRYLGCHEGEPDSVKDANARMVAKRGAGITAHIEGLRPAPFLFLGMKCLTSN